ncbi:periplasmic chaperone for outer membrane proteins Skp [Mucilaginibacter pineti]|uniref:Periplasmic chaperone for outer membrane proteins Skp n=1 Tax=Mucilaginibacter pineti TaxID=1391627 RepID=A0A1G6WCI8_9SPHI|nr:OmpH family outer membrane protein [Mucilaginibacter pineti]SDD63509.1 periplasmic chaperone for outer membrane proteins Skp [Mucilaginibacter pineti]
MKTTASILTKFTLGIAIAGSLAACNQNKTADKPAASTAATVDSKETIVYINSDSLLSKYDYSKDMNKKLEEKGKASQADLQAKGQAFQRQVAEYQKNAATMPADQRQTQEQQLQRKQQELQGYQQNATAEFQQEQGAENAKLYDKIADFTKAYAKEKGYKLVLTYSKANPTVLYGDATLDVTGDVVKRLNDAYAKDKK